MAMQQLRGAGRIRSSMTATVGLRIPPRVWAAHESPTRWGRRREAIRRGGMMGQIRHTASARGGAHHEEHHFRDSGGSGCAAVHTSRKAADDSSADACGPLAHRHQRGAVNVEANDAEGLRARAPTTGAEDNLWGAGWGRTHEPLSIR